MNGRFPAGAAGAVLAAASVGAGAFGAHALQGSLDADHLRLWEAAARYAMYGGLGAIATELVSGAARRWSGILLLVGSLVFAGTLGAIALGGPRALGAITPFGGLSLIAGFLVLAAALWRGPARS